MNKHYVLNINPQAQYDWDKCVLRNPITGERPDFTAMVAQAVSNEPGAYLVSVSVEVQVLEKASAPNLEKSASKTTRVNTPTKLPQLAAS